MAMQPETMAEWVARWQRIGPLLERERVEWFAKEKPEEAMTSFGDIWRLSLNSHPPLPTSGLIEQQRLFGKMRDA